MKKLYFTLLPAMLTFGPLLMTGVLGTTTGDPNWRLRYGVPFAGYMVTIVGLCLLCRIVQVQYREIERLASEVRRLSQRPS